MSRIACHGTSWQFRLTFGILSTAHLPTSQLININCKTKLLTYAAAYTGTYQQDRASFLELSWAFLGVAKHALCDETQVQQGLLFNAKKTVSEYLEGSFMQETCSKMQNSAPNLWNFVYSLVQVDQRCAMPGNDDMDMEHADSHDNWEIDLGEIGGDEMNAMSCRGKHKNTPPQQLKTSRL